MSKIEQIEAFIAVIENNSFAGAAKKQKISTAAVSRQVATLEAGLGAELLTRTTRKITLTDIGNQYYVSCKKILEDLRNAEIEITQCQKEAIGSLVVMSNRYFAQKFLLPGLKKFMVENPKIQLTLELAERFPNLCQENIDLLFGVSIEGPSELIQKVVSTTRYVLCASPAYFKKHGYPEKLSDLCTHHYITHSMRNPDNKLRLKMKKEIYIKPLLGLNDSQVMRECALLGMGIVMLHDYIVSDDLKNGKLIEIFQEYQEPKQNIYLYYQKKRYLQPKIRRFIDFFTSKMNV